MKANLANLTLKSQTILLFGTLLSFNLIFVIALVVAMLEQQRALESESTNGEVLASVNKLLGTNMSCAAAQGMYFFTKDGRFRDQYKIALNHCKVTRKDLENLKGRDARADQVIGRINILMDEAFKVYDESSNLYETRDEVDGMVATVKIKRLISKLMRENDQILSEQDEMRKKAQLARKQAKFWVNAILGIGSVGNAILILLAFYFQSQTSNRFKILSNNIVALGLDQPLSKELIGVENEIAKLDQVLHHASSIIKDSRKKEQAMVENAVDVICSLDENGRFTRVSQAAEKVWDLAPADLLGQFAKNIVTKGDVQLTGEAIQNTIESRKPASFENRIARRDGTFVDALWTAVWSEEDKSLFCVVHDITERRKAERLKQEMMAMISHDLRSPLTSLELTLNVLKSGAFGELNEQVMSRITRAEDSVSQLIRLINDLLDIDKLESGLFVLHKSKAHDSELLNKPVSLLQNLADKDKISLAVEPSDIEVECDEERVVRVITNLLSNAIKFSPPSSEITVSTKIVDNEIEFRVSDQGRGIPEDQVDKVFDRYHQAHRDTETGTTGSGLGLAICKAIIEAHNGTIGATSTVNKGSTFWFRLPK